MQLYDYFYMYYMYLLYYPYYYIDISTGILVKSDPLCDHRWTDSHGALGQVRGASA